LQNEYLFSFDNFSEYYQKNLRVIINREQEDDKENFSRVQSINRMFKRYKRNNYFLSQKIINIYITYLNNNLKELLKTFELIKWDYNKKEKGENKNKEELSYYLDFQLNRYSLFDQSLKTKLFGNYDIVEISDIIEHNLIYKRLFSPYKLIKYSLLNIIAITRLFKSGIFNNQIIMKIICTFCNITQLPIKKYMNIYLNIFQNIYQNENLREEYKITECIKIIYLYFRKTNMIQFEKADNLLNEMEIDAEEEYHLLNTSSISESEDFKEFIKKNGNFFQNKNKDRTIFTRKVNFGNALQSIETIFIGKYENNTFDFDYNELTKLSKKIKLSNKFIPKAPILLYESTNKLLKKYLRNFYNENIQYNELLDDILSLLFYFKIPVIEDKWIESKYDIYHEEDEDDNLDEILKKIIAILYDLFNIIKNKSK